MINTQRLRCMIGWLGMALPWIVVLLLWAFPESISVTYYEAATITPFMIVLGSASFLLISYKGYELWDDMINTFAGIAGLAVCLFPCGNATFDKVGTFQIPQQGSAVIHNIAAVYFFGLLAYNSFFLFTKTDGHMTKQKKARNVIYKICGVGMIGSFALMLLPHFHIKIWLAEALALFFFGVSWLTKANTYKWLFSERTQ